MSYESELKQRAQRSVDRHVNARAELEAATAELKETRAAIAAESTEALAFIDDYHNPKVENPAPIAPDVAAAPPNHEPPVYTSIDTPMLDDVGGFAPVVADGFVDAPLTEDVAPPADTSAASGELPLGDDAQSES